MHGDEHGLVPGLEVSLVAKHVVGPWLLEEMYNAGLFRYDNDTVWQNGDSKIFFFHSIEDVDFKQIIGGKIMSKSEISTSNIGGIKSRKDTVEMGKVNIVRGTSSSRRIVTLLKRNSCLAIVGQTPHEDKYIREVETLHLADRTSRPGDSIPWL